MLHNDLKITDDDITYAGTILFGKKDAFDDDKGECRAFIKNLDTIDLQAVPGSGKTTVLLAKLLILERHLPFEDGSGILVISHTNAAVNEIKKKIAKYCLKLFSYPSFVGTIQSFVDNFLAIPFACSYLNTRLLYIDTEVYQGALWNSFQKIYWNEQAGRPGTWFWRKHIQQAKAQASTDSEAREICNRAIEDEVKDLYFDFSDSKIKRANNKNVVLATGGTPKYDAISRLIKEIVLERGIISFEYAYHLGRTYLEKTPLIKTLLQKRFRYVFVDEMQDMDSHQYHLLEQIFFDEGSSSSIYQRIGDKNQAIFSGDVKLDKIWQDRETPLRLSGSHRLSPNIAKVVEPFGMPHAPIEGRNNEGNNLSPHVIVFDDNSTLGVLPKFCELVKKHIDEGRIPKNCKYPIKAIAWRKGDDGKFGLKNYWPDFEANAAKSQVDYPNLKSYLLFAKKEGSQNNDLDSIHKSILNALLKVLRLEQAKNPDSKTGHFTIGGLQKHLRDKHPEFYEDFRLWLFRWCRDIYAKRIDSVFSDIKSFIPQFLRHFDKPLEKAVDFVNDESLQVISDSSGKSGTIKARDNVYRCENTGLEVEVGTVHSVKGETHTATLYLESYYYQDGRGKNAKSYESQRLKEQFARTPICDSANDRTKQSARVVYVGFSRPTHLLCFAVHTNRFDENVFRNGGWEIYKLG